MSPDPHWDYAAGVLQEALKLVTGDRNEAYGPPEEDFRHIGELWTATLRNKLKADVVVDEVDVALLMIQLKLARETFQQAKRDTLVDICGYAACLARIRSQQASE